MIWMGYPNLTRLVDDFGEDRQPSTIFSQFTHLASMTDFQIPISNLSLSLRGHLPVLLLYPTTGSSPLPSTSTSSQRTERPPSRGEPIIDSTGVPVDFKDTSDMGGGHGPEFGDGQTVSSYQEVTVDDAGILPFSMSELPPHEALHKSKSPDAQARQAV